MPRLRVISGKARGRRLQSVPGNSTRPITDRAKESLFNILSPDIVDSSFLDLFAGTGSVGIEALSRGAEYVLFVDKSRQAVEIIKVNLRNTDLMNGAKVMQSDAFRLLERTPDRRFDFIYIAPPQYKGHWKKALGKIDQNIDWLVDDAWVIVQIHPVEYEITTLDNLREIDLRKYGSTQFIFFEVNTIGE